MFLHKSMHRIGSQTIYQKVCLRTNRVPYWVRTMTPQFQGSEDPNPKIGANGHFPAKSEKSY